MATDSRGRLEAKPFGYRLTKGGDVRITFEGRVVTVLRGKPATRLLNTLRSAEPHEVQLALAKATGNFKRGNGRRDKT